jgi:enterochelin esterase-like enzyme
MNRALLNLELLHPLVRPATPSSSPAERSRVQLFLRYQSSGAASSRRVASGSAASRYPDRFGHIHAFVGQVIKTVFNNLDKLKKTMQCNELQCNLNST